MEEDREASKWKTSEIIRSRPQVDFKSLWGKG